MFDYNAMKAGVLSTTAAIRAGMAGMKDKAARLKQTEEHRKGILRGFDLCLELVDDLERSADDAIAEVRAEIQGYDAINDIPEQSGIRRKCDR